MDRTTVKRRREKLHLTQTAVARAVGITRAAVCRYEANDLNLSEDTEDRIAEILGIDRLRRAKRDLRRHLAGASRAIDSLQSQVVEA